VALVLIPVFVVVAALTPASASTQGNTNSGQTSTNSCTASVKSTQDAMAVAFSVTCPWNIAHVEIKATDNGSLRGDPGTTHYTTSS
jgi:hypothetical protein